MFVHAIWSVKNSERRLLKPVRKKLFDHMLQQAKAKDFHIIAVNGVEDHIHCLLQLHPTQNVSSVIQLLKGESSHWLNQNKMVDDVFKWQDGYAVYSISPSAINNVIKYIERQEEHHNTKSLDDELNVIGDTNFLPMPTG